MISTARAQDIETPWVRVDTGNDWRDLGFFLIVVVVLAATYVFVRRALRK